MTPRVKRARASAIWAGPPVRLLATFRKTCKCCVTISAVSRSRWRTSSPIEATRHGSGPGLVCRDVGEVDRARSGVDGAMSDAQDKGQQAVDAMREISDKFVETVDESIKNRPYTTLAIAVGLGFLFGSTWRR